MDTTDLPATTLDCWVERAELLRINPQASAADLASISHWPKYTLNHELARPIIEREGIDVEQIDDPYRGMVFLARIPDLLRSELDDGISFDDTYLDAVMLCYVESLFGVGIEDRLLWENGEPRYQPFE
jgi:hypothetical protein